MDSSGEGVLVPAGEETLRLGPGAIAWKGKVLPWDSISGLAYGSTVTRDGLGDFHGVLSVTDGAELLQVDWVHDRKSPGPPRSWVAACFNAACQILWNTVQLRIAGEMVEALRAGKAVSVGSLRIDGEGLALAGSPPEGSVLGGLERYLAAGKATAAGGSSVEKRLPWEEVDACQEEEGGIAVYGRGEEHPWCILDSCNTWNAVCLPEVVLRVGGFHELDGEPAEEPGH